MTPDMANTPARRIYFALQTAYIGDYDERKAGLQLARELSLEFREATTSEMVKDLLDRALKSAEMDQCYQALKLARRVMRHEEVVLGLSPVASVSIPEDVA